MWTGTIHKYRHPIVDQNFCAPGHGHYTRCDPFCLAINILTMPYIIVAANIKDYNSKKKKKGK